MPNWVHNHLTINGDKQFLDKLACQLNQPFCQRRLVFSNSSIEFEDVVYSQPIFAFWNIVRPSDDQFEDYFAGENDVSNASDHWYEWNLANWGTKWDVAIADGHVRGHVRIHRESDTVIEYEFETAWNQPYEALLKLSSQFPSLKFSNVFQDEAEEDENQVCYHNGQARLLAGDTLQEELAAQMAMLVNILRTPQ